MKCNICGAEMFRVPRSTENDVDVADPYWMCSKCEHVQLVSYAIVFYRDEERTNFVLMNKDGWNKVGPLLVENFDLFPIDEEADV